MPSTTEIFWSFDSEFELGIPLVRLMSVKVDAERSTKARTEVCSSSKYDTIKADRTGECIIQKRQMDRSYW